jgi:hypothetical protein
MKKNTVFPMLAVALLAVWGQAQAAPNLSGEWKLNTSKSDFGPAPAPEMMMRTIKHSEPSLEITTHQKGAQGEITTELKYTTDGKECVNKLPNGEARGRAKWDADTLVVESVRDFQGTELKSKETWELSEAGKILTINNHITLPQGEFDLKLVFDKQ